MVTIEHSDAGAGELRERPASFSDLVRRLDELAAEYQPICKIPYAVDLVRENAGRLAVGMGETEWMLSYFPPSDDQPMNSLGDRTASGSVPFFFGDHTLVSRKYLIPKSLAIQAVRDWWETGSLSPAVTWTDEIFFRL